MYRLWQCHYECDVERFTEMLINVGGKFISAHHVPFYSYLGKEVGLMWVVVYYYADELDMEIKC